MRYRRIGIVALLVLACTAAVLFGQSALEDFPVGTTYMKYEVITEEMQSPQVLTLTIAGYEDGRYQVSALTEATGTPDELAGFGFILGAAGVRYGSSDISYPALQALIDRRAQLEEGEEYLLPGGGRFTDITAVTIASVLSLQGTFKNPDHPDSRMTIALALSHPVFVSPLIRVEERQVDGSWTTVFAMMLTEYAFTPVEE